jgi:hypothetical protein
MANAETNTEVCGERLTRGDLELAIHALHGVLEVLDWIDDVQIGVSDERQRDARTSLLLAGRLITEDFRRRF